MLPTRIVMLATAVAVTTVSAAETLNVKTGLWEVTTTTQSKGVPPLPKEMLDRMSPEQRKKMEADIRAAQNKSDTNTDRECITKDEIERPFESSNAKDCEQTIVSSTRTSQHISIVCTGSTPGSGSFKITAFSPESITGALDLKIGEGTQTMTINSQMKGRWLGSDCGDEADDADEADDDVTDDATAEP